MKEDSVSRQSSIDAFRYDWIHLQAAILKESSVRYQSSVVSVQIRLDSLTNCNNKGGHCQLSIEYRSTQI